MGIKLSDLQKNRREITIQADGEELKITYCPGKITPATEDVSLNQIEKGRAGNGYAKYLASILVDWDVLDEDGKKVKPTYDFLCQVPTETLGEMILAIRQDLNVSKEERKN